MEYVETWGGGEGGQTVNIIRLSMSRLGRGGGKIVDRPHHNQPLTTIVAPILQATLNNIERHLSEFTCFSTRSAGPILHHRMYGIIPF